MENLWVELGETNKGIQLKKEIQVLRSGNETRWLTGVICWSTLNQALLLGKGEKRSRPLSKIFWKREAHSDKMLQLHIETNL